MDAWNVVKDMELYQTTAVGSGGSLSMQSGKINVLLFGRMGSCANTMKVANSLEALLTEDAADEVNVYLLDISQPRSDVVQSVNQAGWNHIDVCSSPDNSGYYGTYLWALVNKTIRPAGGSITLPGVFIFDRNQAVTLSETGLVTQDRLAEVLLDSG